MMPGGLVLVQGPRLVRIPHYCSGAIVTGSGALYTGKEASLWVRRPFDRSGCLVVGLGPGY